MMARIEEDYNIGKLEKRKVRSRFQANIVL